MPGTFSRDARPSRPGGYTNFEALVTASIPPATGSIVALPIVHDWGPFAQSTLVESWGEFVATYGDTDTPGARAVAMAFKGENLPGSHGAGAVRVYRMGVSSAAKATRILTNTTPVTALTLSAEYIGTRGNGLTVTVQTNSADATKKDVIFKFNGRVVESYTWLQTDLAGLANQINLYSHWATAVVNVDGVALTNVSNSAFTGGTDGGTLTATEYTNVMSALEFERFGYLAFPNLTDPSIIASLKTWVIGRNSSGQRFRAIIGGDPSDTVTLANTRSRLQNNENIINLGGFTVLDDDYAAAVVSSAMLAPRFAGILANRGMNRSATFARLAGVRLLVPPTSTDVDLAFAAGTVLLSRDSYAAAPVRIEKSLTTYSDDTTAKPYRIFRNPKFMATMGDLETQITEHVEAPGVIGELGVNDKVRASLVAEAGARLRSMEDQGIIQSGWTVAIDQNPPPSDDDEFVALKYGLRFMRSIEQVYSTIVVA